MHRTTSALIFSAVLLSMLMSFGSPALAVAQSDDSSDPQPVVVTFETADGSTFRAVLEQPADIAAVEAALAGDGDAGIPNGNLAYGDSGVNAPHGWHMVDTMLADITIELCDGTASMVDDDIEYWVETVGRFCPWSATVIAVEPVDLPDPGDGIPDQVRQLVERLITVLQAILADLMPQQAD